MTEIDPELLTAVWSTLHQCRCAFGALFTLSAPAPYTASKAALAAVNEAIELLEEAYGTEEQSE